jgi:hypothetical protein
MKDEDIAIPLLGLSCLAVSITWGEFFGLFLMWLCWTIHWWITNWSK